MGIRKNFTMEMMVKHCNALRREVAESPALEGFQGHVEVAPRDVAWWWDSVGLSVIWKVFSHLDDSVIV